MKIFLAGATGVIGSRLLPALLERGDEVAAMTRRPERAEALLALGAVPVVCDVYDLDELTRHMVDFAPELVIHQLTDLPDNPGEIASGAAANARMRREGTHNLLSAARQAGATRLLAQSVAWEPAGDGAVAKAELEAGVLGFGGVVVRYGQLYGPGTYHPDTPPEPPRVGVATAVAATVDALDLPSQIITVCD
jgi:nucleoside-diphosphate-sugar epimerase